MLNLFVQQIQKKTELGLLRNKEIFAR